jgi:hypothetical protein
MAIIMGQAAVTGTVPIFTVPPGPCAVTMYVATGAVYVGTSTVLTTATGMSVPTTPVTFESFPGSRGAQLYGTVGTAATTVAINYVVSTGA